MRLWIWLALTALLYLFLIRPRFRKADAAAFLNVCFAHRGLHDLRAGIPENSLPAFRRAVEAGYGIELDVRLSGDGVPIVFHDAKLSRMCAIDLRADSLSCRKLREYPLAGTQERIPTLAEALQVVDGRVPLLVEIKMERMDRRIPQKIDALLQGYRGAYCVESFHPLALWWYRRHRPDVPRGQLATHFNAENRSLSPFQFLLGKMVLNVVSRPDFISYNWRFRKDISLFLCRRIFGAHAAGWVIRSPQELETCRRTFGMFIFEDFLP